MVQAKATDLLQEVLAALAALGEPILYVVIYFAIAKVASTFIRARLRNSRFLAKYGRDGEMLASRSISIVAYVIAALAALSQMGVHSTGLLTLLSAFTVAIGLSLQDVMKNMFSGLFMLAERPFSVGDRVRVRDKSGTVQGIDIRTTVLKTDDGSLLMVPNSLMFTEILQNDSRYQVRHIKLEITSVMPAEEITRKLHGVAVNIDGIRLPMEPLRLIRRDESGGTWQIGIGYDSNVLTDESTMVTAILNVLPDATISRVTT